VVGFHRMVGQQTGQVLEVRHAQTTNVRFKNIGQDERSPLTGVLKGI